MKRRNFLASILVLLPMPFLELKKKRKVNDLQEDILLTNGYSIIHIERGNARWGFNSKPHPGYIYKTDCYSILVPLFKYNDTELFYNIINMERTIEKDNPKKLDRLAFITNDGLIGLLLDYNYPYGDTGIVTGVIATT